MFKIAFPWGKQAEEKNEREYLRGRPDTSEDETAGNVWISPGLGRLSDKFCVRVELTISSIGFSTRI